jgi:competence protein ComEC
MAWGETAGPRSRAVAGAISAAGRRAGLALPRGIVVRLVQARRLLAQWAAAEAGPGRLMPWVPVGFGTGIALYFAAEREPAWWAPASLTAGLVIVAVAARRRSLGFPLAVVAAAMAAGFLVATLRTVALGHPVLRQASFGIAVTGFVETREERERSDRIVVAVHSINGPRLEEQLERVRVAVRKGTAPPVGSFVSFTARLTPPLPPLRPGGYDFARDFYFKRLGATGFVTGAVRIEAPPETTPSLRRRLSSTVDALRDAIDARIRAAIPGDAGVIASALITGKRDAISTPVNEAMYVSSLGHVLSISGYHMAVVAGVVFFAVRGLLALVPGLALRRPIKKWAAAAALPMAGFYLVLSGAEVATQRAFLMTAVVLLGVMADRRALTLRTLAIAALTVMVLAPETIVHPSFQMSFAATLALVAVYDRGLPGPVAGRDTSRIGRAALWGVREILALLVASLVAGAATTPFAAYHFHRLAPFGVVANLLAMPIVSAFVMPAGLLGLVALPFGFDAPLWQLMGVGVGWMTAVAQWVAALPGAVGRVSAFGMDALLPGTAGLVVICLLRTPLRWCGIGLVALAILVAMRTPLPDVLVAADGGSLAVRGRDGRLQIFKGGNGFAVREWLAADGDERIATDSTLGQGFTCDPDGCVAHLADGTRVAVARTPDALADDCLRAVLVLTSRTAAPPACAAFVIDREAVRRDGAMALYRIGEGWRVESARPQRLDRPWARPASVPTPAAAGPSRPAPRDATPRRDDLEADD